MKIHNLISLIFLFSIPISADQCGKKSSVATCPMGICSGGCGSGFLRRCGSHIQFAIPGGDGGGISNILNSSNFELMLKYRNDPRCPSSGFYSYTSFISAANSFDGFGTTGNPNIRKRELAAFLAQTSHETTGGWPTAPDGPYAWGYCYVNETSQDSYCNPSPNWPCASGKKYYGRGPFQITYNFNYGPAGSAIGVDLLNNPDRVATDPTISFKTALWFWMTPRGNNIPSIHDIITGAWIPSNDDTSAGRVPGYGVITNIINGNLECGIERDSRAADRIGFYKRYCDILGVGYGDNLDCSNQKPFS